MPLSYGTAEQLKADSGANCVQILAVPIHSHVTWEVTTFFSKTDKADPMIPHLALRVVPPLGEPRGEAGLLTAPINL